MRPHSQLACYCVTHYKLFRQLKALELQRYHSHRGTAEINSTLFNEPYVDSNQQTRQIRYMQLCEL
jgi:hypothetical protein